ncbi:MAG TPA: glutaredoxin family protein [Chloroflexi bacterium]|nr:glutaredoxin family protein [Chloroflexota bacterium]
MVQARGYVSGANEVHHITFYGLSTCIWCKRTRQFLEDEDVAFDYIYIDLLHGSEREEAVEQVRRWNPATSFPTVVVDGEQSVVGFKPEELAQILEL